MVNKVLNNKRFYCWLTLGLILFIILISSTVSADSAQSASSLKTYAYVTNYKSGTVSVINMAANTVTATVKVGNEPLGVAINPDGRNVYVADKGVNNVYVIDTVTNTVTDKVKVGKGPVGIAITPDGKEAYVANANSNTVSVIDTVTKEVTATVKVENSPGGIAVNPAGTKVYVANYGSGTTSVIDTDTNNVIATVDVGDHPQGVAVTPDGKKVYVPFGDNFVSVIDTSTDNTTTLNVRNRPCGVAITPDGSTLYVTNSGDGSVSIIDTATNDYIGTVNVGSSPQGVAVTPDGKKVYVANANSNTVSVIRTDSNSVIASVNVGSNPVALGQFIGSLPTVTLGSLLVSMSTESGSVEPDKPLIINVTVTGTDGKVISGANVELMTDLGELSPTSGTTDSSGKFISTFSSSTEGTATITAMLETEGLVSISGETIEVKNNEPALAPAPKVLVSSEPGSVELNKPLAITVAVTGNDNIGIPGASVELTTDVGKVNPASGITNSSGMFTSTFISSAEGKAQIKAQVKKKNLSSARGETSIEVIKSPDTTIPILVISALLFLLVGIVISKRVINNAKRNDKKPDPKIVPHEAGLDIQIEPDSIPADGESTAKVTIGIKDEKGDFISSPNGRIVELSTTFGTINSPVKILPGEATATATIISGSEIGIAEVTASSNPLKEAKAKVDFVPNAVSLDIQIKPGSVCADGQSKAKVIIKAKDDQGNFVPSYTGRVIKLYITRGTIDSQVLIPPGKLEGIAYITSGSEIGIAEVTASSILEGDKESLNGTGKVTFTLPSEDPACSVPK